MILGYGPDKQIIGLTGDALAQFGIGSSTGTSSDPFLLTNFINPPSVPDSLSVTSSSSDIYVIYNYNSLPDIINTHFNAQGKPDGSGEK
ncbi:MAG: DUF1648 domain-containing protein, partial [Actinobacteria bacterium]|nr:DUF1648 domain-containing protein [Actinomycetota bacterium]